MLDEICESKLVNYGFRERNKWFFYSFSNLSFKSEWTQISEIFNGQKNHVHAVAKLSTLSVHLRDCHFMHGVFDESQHFDVTL